MAKVKDRMRNVPLYGGVKAPVKHRRLGRIILGVSGLGLLGMSVFVLIGHVSSSSPTAFPNSRPVGVQEATGQSNYAFPPMPVPKDVR